MPVVTSSSANLVAYTHWLLDLAVEMALALALPVGTIATATELTLGFRPYKFIVGKMLGWQHWIWHQQLALECNHFQNEVESYQSPVIYGIST